MHEFHLLRDLVVIFAVAVAVVALLRRVGFPSIAGFILAGVLIGPHATGLIANAGDVEQLAEVGVALLLFGIGLELSLDILRRLLRFVLLGGAVQVGTTIVVAALLAVAFGESPRAAVFLGCLIAVSSTAIVLRGLRARGELEAPHGRLTLGILLFQDLCVVPMMLAIPLLASEAGSGRGVLLAMGKAAVMLTGVVVAGRLVVPRVLHAVARTRQRDLFVLTVFLVCAGTAWVLSQAGLSLALGAFMGGLVVGGSEYRYQALSDVIPFRDVLTSVFFVSVGMLFDPRVLLEHPGTVAAMFVAVLFGKFVLVFLTALAMRLPLRVCILSGMALSQIGEFAFVLLHAGRAQGLLDDRVGDPLYAVVVLSMLVTPLMIASGPHLAAGVGRLQALTRAMGVRTPEDPHVGVRHLSDHVIIAGFGLTGQELARALREVGIPYVVVDLNPESVRAAIRNKEPMFYGDVTSAEVLEHLGAEAARELILVVNDPDAAVRAIQAAHQVAPRLPVVVRARYLGDKGPLLRAGAAEVIAAEIEAAGKVTERVLARHRVEPTAIIAQLSTFRSRYPDQGGPPPEEPGAG